MYTKIGFPEKGEFVVCTVKSVDQHLIHFKLDEYKDIDGTVTSSEISRRMARNIRIYFKPGRKNICKVMRLEKASKHIYLSIRRVGASQAQTKQKEWNNEKKADDLISAMSIALKTKYETLFEKIGRPVLEKYGLIYPFLLEILENEKIVQELKLNKKLEKEFVDYVKGRIKQRKARITGILEIKSLNPNGLDIIKKSLNDLKSNALKEGGDIQVKYLGAPKYKIIFGTTNLKQGNRMFENIFQQMEKYIKKQSSSIKFTKTTS